MVGLQPHYVICNSAGKAAATLTVHVMCIQLIGASVGVLHITCTTLPTLGGEGRIGRGCLPPKKCYSPTIKNRFVLFALD